MVTVTFTDILLNLRVPLILPVRDLFTFWFHVETDEFLVAFLKVNGGHDGSLTVLLCVRFTLKTVFQSFFSP